MTDQLDADPSWMVPTTQNEIMASEDTVAPTRIESHQNLKILLDIFIGE